MLRRVASRRVTRLSRAPGHRSHTTVVELAVGSRKIRRTTKTKTSTRRCARAYRSGRKKSACRRVTYTSGLTTGVKKDTCVPWSPMRIVMPNRSNVWLFCAACADPCFSYTSSRSCIEQDDFDVLANGVNSLGLYVRAYGAVGYDFKFKALDIGSLPLVAAHPPLPRPIDLLAFSSQSHHHHHHHYHYPLTHPSTGHGVQIACCDALLAIDHPEYWQRAWCLTEQVGYLRAFATSFQTTPALAPSSSRCTQARPPRLPVP